MNTAQSPNSDTRSSLLNQDKNNIAIAYMGAVELVSFLSSEGNLPDKIATAEFFAILEKARLEELSPEEEFIFWRSYSQLAEHAKPTQVDALQFRNYLLGRPAATKNAEERYRRNLESMRNIRIYSLISFGLTLLFLTYLSLTGGYMSRNDTLAQEYRLIASGIYRGTRLEELQETGFRNVIQEDNVSGSEDDEVSGGEGGGFTTGTASSNQSLDNAYFRAQLASALGEITSLVEYNTAALRIFQLNFGLGSGEESLSARSNRFSVKDLRVESRQKSINHIISSYFLPVFTSLLGVTVFILRRTSTSINSGRYRLYESGTYSYRITLGIVGGIVISWFSTTDTSGIVSSITPAALAFVVGYSIEVLYNVLDSIVKALGADDADAS